MLTGEIRNQVDRIWDAFWSEGISNSLEEIEQLYYPLFIKRVDELHMKDARFTLPPEKTGLHIYEEVAYKFLF